MSKFKLSKAYASKDHAAMGGFRKITKSHPDWDTYEYGFFVIMKTTTTGGKTVAQYYYTEPQTDRSTTEVEVPLPDEPMVRAYCHTHPQSVQTTGFSTGDKRWFQAAAKARPGIGYYLLNPFSEIRRAVSEDEFPAGVTVNWDKSVTP